MEVKLGPLLPPVSIGVAMLRLLASMVDQQTQRRDEIRMKLSRDREWFNGRS